MGRVELLPNDGQDGQAERSPGVIRSPGQRNDIAFAHALVDGFTPKATIADKGYDADHLTASRRSAGVHAFNIDSWRDSDSITPAARRNAKLDTMRAQAC